MPELTLLIDETNGAMLLEGSQLPAAVLADMTALTGEGKECGCARPLEVLLPPVASKEELAMNTCVRIAGYYHNSLVEGPGRRSSVLLQSCPLQCRGCWVPQLHEEQAGSMVSVERLAEALLDPAFERDGVSILGGEPFAQPEGLWALIQELRARGCAHILCYSGYTYEALRERATRQPGIGAVLNEIDLLVDGPYIESQAETAGPWTGSGNQRVIDMRETRRAGQIVLF